jgi:HEPN domain-containing protein
MDKLQFEKELYLSAKEDLKSSAYLYSKKIYSLSIYHLQQTVEKLYKILSLNYNCEVDELKKIIGHYGVNCMSLLDKKIELEIAKLEKKDLEILKIEKSIKKMYKRKKIKMDFLGIISEKMILELTDSRKCQARWDKIYTVPPDSSKPLNSSAIFDKRRTKKNMHGVIFLDIEIFKLSLVLDPHIESTRYPGKYLAPSKYTKDLGIVKAYPKLMEMVRKICILLEPGKFKLTPMRRFNNFSG